MVDCDGTKIYWSAPVKLALASASGWISDKAHVIQVGMPEGNTKGDKMGKELQWSKETYERSISSKCWWYTPYDDGWDNCKELAKDDELRQIVMMEYKLSPIPEWAKRIAERDINLSTPCGHYTFPRNYLEILGAIGSETPQTFIHGCYTVDRERKEQMIDYVFCLDAWLVGASYESSANELTALGYRKIDWQKACKDMWKILGEHTELKDLLVERLIYSQRWKLKACIWDDDLANVFGRDQYLGDYASKFDDNCTELLAGFDEKSSPKIKRLESRLAEICLDWDYFSFHIQYGWLCAPKAFRYLERLIWSIGQERALKNHDEVNEYLCSNDLCINQDQASKWWKKFIPALDAWWQSQTLGEDVAIDVYKRLGEITPTKQWLVRLFLRKLRRLEENNEEFARLVNPPPKSHRGTKPIF